MTTRARSLKVSTRTSLSEQAVSGKTLYIFQTIRMRPSAFGILIDSTGSMGKMPEGAESGLAAATAITRILLRYLKPDDEVLVMTFSRSLW